MALTEVLYATDTSHPRVVSGASIRKRITIKHPKLRAWAQLGAVTRISLHHSLAATGMQTAGAPTVIIPPPVSGPFFGGSDG